MSDAGCLLMLVLIVLSIAVFIAVQRAGRRGSGVTGASQESMAPVVRALTGPLAGQTFALTGADLRLGRRADCEIVVDAPLVSRVHAVIRWTPEHGGWWIVDQDSSNGTWVNDQRIATQMLRPNDRIAVGPSVFVFQVVGAPQPGKPPNGAIPLAQPAAQPQVSLSALQRIHDLSDYDLSELGRGGEGVAYLGVARSDGSLVVVKVLQSQNPYLERKFQQTADVSLKLRHPHLITVYRLGSRDGAYYVIMEYAAGKSLRERLQPGVPYPPTDAIRLLGQTCDGLQFAHQYGVVHRDIKPANILFDTAGNVKLTDFGIAKLLSAPTMTSAGTILGTPAYMSCEQARGQTVVPQSDIYSLGVLAYQLFTGRLPFDAPDMWRILDQHLLEMPRPPRQINPVISPEVEGAILRALEKDAARRFPNCEAFARALGYTAPFHPGTVVGEPASTPAAVRSGAPYLVVESNGLCVPITGPELVITRQLLGGHPSVSRQHARIVAQADGLWLRDEGSSNGTRHNGQAVSGWVAIQPGDQVIFGSVAVRVQAGGEASSSVFRT
jgi:pSer/pThr/pTyr-binding forkhead associated (FHA) protein